MLELLYAHVHREPPPASTRNPGLSPAVDAVLARGLAKDPATRWETGSTMVAALRGALSGEAAPAVDATMALPQPVPAEPAPAAAVAAVTAPAPPVKRRYGRRLLAGAVGGVLLLAVALVLLALASRVHPTVTLSTASVEQGGVVAARFAGFKPGETVDVYVASTEQRLATVRADTQGRVVYAFTVPRNFATGRHELKGCAGTNCTQAAFTVAVRRVP
jgi:hypothetical protein